MKGLLAASVTDCQPSLQGLSPSSGVCWRYCSISSLAAWILVSSSSLSLDCLGLVSILSIYACVKSARAAPPRGDLTLLNLTSIAGSISLRTIERTFVMKPSDATLRVSTWLVSTSEIESLPSFQLASS